jgi:hypothetical protein
MADQRRLYNEQSENGNLKCRSLDAAAITKLRMTAARASVFILFAVLRLTSGKPRTTDLCPWLWRTALSKISEHSSPHSRTGRSVVQGKPVKIDHPALTVLSENQRRVDAAECKVVGHDIFALSLAPFIDDVIEVSAVRIDLG